MGRLRPPRSRLLRGVAAGALAALVGSALVVTGAGAADAVPASVGGLTPHGQQFSAGHYVVTLRAPAAATYQGGLEGIPGTKPLAGTQLRMTSDPVRRYTDYLRSRQDAVAKSVGASIGYSYTVALNGFSADLSAAQASTLATDSQVASVVPDAIVHPQDVDSMSSDHFLGLDGTDGVWATKAGGVAKAGAGIVLGDIDTGIAPENPSFAGAALGTTTSTTQAYRTADGVIHYAKADGGQFTGTCQTGVQFTAADCTQKIVGARYFVKGFTQAKIGDPSVGEYLSPRDGAGHGSHTASTAAGDNGVDTTVAGRSFGKISGVAPAARIAVYKACWSGPDPSTEDDDGCATADLVAAIDQAVKDGVDVLNYSIGGGAAQTTVSLTDQAFFNAAAAGVFVSAAAGNAGPNPSTLDNAAPWETTVAASTIPGYEATVQLGNGQSYAGASVTVSSPVQGDLVRGDLVGVAGAKAGDPLLCGPDSLDPAKVTGKIVWCQRGVYDRVAKSAEVARAGGIGMVLVNKTPNSIDSDTHSVPTVHLNSEYYQPTFDYAGTAGATATLVSGNKTNVTVPVPQIADFSSRGPVEADGSDILKPDVAAPGVAILAAVANAAGASPQWAFYSGTSMATPHVAGLALLYLGVHPTATPAEIKSAIMTTAYDTKAADGSDVTDPFSQGAGEIRPTRYFDPGLLYLNGPNDWAGYIEGLGYSLDGSGLTGYGADVKPIDASQLNLPSIAIGTLTKPETITRTVTSTRAGTYTAGPVSMPGVDVTVSPSQLSFTGAGQSKSYTVTFARTSAPVDAFATGYLTWSDSATGIQVRSPLAVRPVAIVTPSDATGTGASGSTAVTVTGGENASVPLTLNGLSQGVLQRDPGNASSAHSGTGSAGKEFSYSVTVPQGARWARFDEKSLSSDSSVDLDLYVSRLDASGKPAVTYTSATSSASERVDIPKPTAGTYQVLVDVYSGTNATFDLSTYVVKSGADQGSLTASPNPLPLTQGADTNYTLSWKGLAASARYLAVVDYGSTGKSTALTVTTPAAAPVAVSKPTISGTPAVGSTLTATPGTWNQTGLAYAYQWSVGGVAVPSATAPTYVVRSADQGKQITVRVTASKAGTPSGSATSDPVTVIASSSLSLSLSSPFAFSFQRVKATVRVTSASASAASGTVSVTVAGRSYPVTLTNGSGSVLLPRLHRGIYTVTASYAGDAATTAATAQQRFLFVLF